MRIHQSAWGLLCGSVLAIVALPSADASTVVRVTVENLAPQNGVNLTPVWVGFHDGTFDTFDAGTAASMEVERLAEDGMTGPLSAAFHASGAGGVDATLGSAPIAPGASVSGLFTIDPMSPLNRYFSFASMVVPSNDAFIGNDNPMAWQLVSPSGRFNSFSFVVLGAMVRDAGTETNDEIPANTALLGQTVPNTGVPEGAAVMFHPGFLPPGAGGILANPMFANADFTVPGYEVARVTVAPIPEPSTVLLLGAGLSALAILRRRRQRAK